MPPGIDDSCTTHKIAIKTQVSLNYFTPIMMAVLMIRTENCSDIYDL